MILYQQNIGDINIDLLLLYDWYNGVCGEGVEEGVNL